MKQQPNNRSIGAKQSQETREQIYVHPVPTWSEVVRVRVMLINIRHGITLQRLLPSMVRQTRSYSNPIAKHGVEPASPC